MLQVIITLQMVSHYGLVYSPHIFSLSQTLECASLYSRLKAATTGFPSTKLHVNAFLSNGILRHTLRVETVIESICVTNVKLAIVCRP